MKKIIVTLTLALALPLNAQQLPAKKFIHLGWDKPDAATLRHNIDQMEKSPFDGVIIGITGQTEKEEKVEVRNTFNNVVWKKEWFEQSINDLKAISPQRLKNNFVQVCTYPGNVDWFNDAGWKNVVEHWRIAAWLAREGKLKGIAFDPEVYHPKYQQFNYYNQANQKKYTFAQYQEKARQRGREVIKAVKEAYPDIVILCTWMNSLNAQAVHAQSPQQALLVNHYNLYPAFINGWLDDAAPEMTFVDGCEFAYTFNSEWEFLKMNNIIRHESLSLVAPENHAKYAQQVQAGFGLFLDSYISPNNSRWFIERKGQSSLQRFTANLQSARNSADEYVWIYGQKYRWWETNNKNVSQENWNEIIPGIANAVENSKGPGGDAGLADSSLKNKINLIKNGEFNTNLIATPNAQPRLKPDWKTDAGIPQWNTWQSRLSNGTFNLDATLSHHPDKSGCARISSVYDGNLVQAIQVKPGEQYVIESSLRQTGLGVAYIRIMWQKPSKRWLGDTEFHYVLTPGEVVDQNGWKTVKGVVTVPDEVNWLIIGLCAKHQKSDTDVVWFDDVRIYKVDAQ